MALIQPTGPLEVVFSFDTTGSMYSCLEQVRGRINDMIQRLQTDIPGIRTAVIAHGDYCDVNTYVTKWIDFTTNVADLCAFVNNAERTGGGDSPECYELVLHQTRTKLSWTRFSRRVLVLIGDAEPHGPDYPANKDKIDWKYETKELALMDVTIYPVQCGNHGLHVTAFYKTLATVTNGKHLKLDDFGNLFDVLMAVCYREGNDTAMLASYEKEVRARCGSAALANDIDAIFTSLRDGDSSSTHSADSSTVTPKTSPALFSLATTACPFAPIKTPALKTVTSSGFKVKPPTARRLPLKSPLRRGKTSKSRPAVVDRWLDSYREENLSLLKRENVPNINFKLRDLTWSPWTLVLSPELPERNAEKWVKRRGGYHHGYRLHTLEPNKPNNSSKDNKSFVLFEVSVQVPAEGKQRLPHHVVYSSFTKRCFDNNKWEPALFRDVREQVESLLSNGCLIFMRFYSLSVRDEVSSLRGDLRRYDYAWRRIRNVRTQPRSVVKGGCAISTSSF